MLRALKNRYFTYLTSIFSCFSEILHEAEELWIRQGSDTSSEAGSSTTGTGSDISETASSHRSLHRSALAQALAKQNGGVGLPPLHAHHVGPTIITVNGVSASIGGNHNLDSMLYRYVFLKNQFFFSDFHQI